MSSSRKQPLLWSVLFPMFAQRFVQHLAEHYFAVFKSFAADSDNHSFAVNVADSHIGQLSAPHSGGIQRHQYYTVKREVSGFDQKTDFFRAQYVRQTDHSFWIRSFCRVPWMMQGLYEEKTQGGKALVDRVRRKFLVSKQVCLVVANVLQAQSVRRAVEI